MCYKIEAQKEVGGKLNEKLQDVPIIKDFDNF